MRKEILRLLLEEDGQDLIEYALLTGAIALSCFGGFSALENAIATSYPVWDNNQQTLWEPCNPGLTRSCPTCPCS